MVKAVTGTIAQRAVLYLRRSTDRQEQSIGDQRSELDRFAREHGYDVVAEYVDDAVSGVGADGRKDFQRMIADAARRDRPFDRILVYDVKRLSRGNSDEAGYYRHVLRQHGVEIVYATEGFAGNDTDDMVLNVKQWLAHQESKQLSKVTLRGQLSNANGGWWNGGVPPYGYDLAYVDGQGTPQTRVRFLETGEKLVMDPDGTPRRTLARRDQVSRSKSDKTRLVLSATERVATLKRIFEMYVRRDLGYKAIAEALNVEGVPSPKNGTWSNHTGPGWSLSTIRSILVNPVYTGEMVWNRRAGGKFHSVVGGRAEERNGVGTNGFSWNDEEDRVTIPDAHPAIIDRRTFDAAQKLRESRSRRNGGASYRSGRAKHSEYLLGGLVKCTRCGHGYHGRSVNSIKRRKNGEKIRTLYYACGGAVSKGRAVCEKRLVRKRELEDEIVGRIGERVGQFLSDGGDQVLKEYLVAETQAEYQAPRQRRQQLQSLIQKTNEDIDRLVRSLTPDNKDFVDPKLKDLGKERKRLQRELDDLKEVPDKDVDVNQLVDEVLGCMENFDDVFKEGTLEEKKEFIRLFVEDIQLDAAGMTATVRIRKFPAAQTVAAGNSAFEMVAGARYKAQKQIIPPVDVIELRLVKRGGALVPAVA
jgi:DNA invertase Pin-like site-specific DNA recombinase